MSAAPEINATFESNGFTQELAPGPIGGPGAWRRPDIAKRADEWTYALSAAEIRELDDAMQRTRTSQILDIDKAAFDLPKLAATLAEIKHQLLEGRGFVLIRGVPVADYTLEESARVYWGIGMHLGTARSQNAKGHLLGHVCNLGDHLDPFGNPAKARIYQTRDRQLFHTDSTDFVGLLCLQKSKSGGESSISSSIAIHDEMYRRDRTLWEEMYKPFWRDRRGEVPPGKKDYYPMAVFHYYAGKLSTIYSRDYIESCQRFDEVPPLTDTQTAALNMFDEMSENLEFRLDMAFEPGDIQLLHNHQILHARAGFEDWPEIERRRHLLRLWLCPDNGRPLPDSMRERYLSIDIGDRGGIIGGNTELNVPLEPV
ncbi:MAG: TauD/TfdA family dioxygenase [Pseudomonadota bacterium]|nr:TauD/TfdA family dioxygenase [Pseudomonadota bacterium]